MAPARACPQPATRVASAAPNAESDGFFSNLARKVGFGGTRIPPPPRSRPGETEGHRGQADEPPRAPEAARSPNRASKPETKQAATRPPLKPSVSDTRPPPRRPRRTAWSPARSRSCRPNSFDSRFSAVK